MGRIFYVNGETLVSYGGQQLGLAPDPIRVKITPKYLDIQVDSWGAGNVPPEVQNMLAEAHITMTLVNFDPSVLQTATANMMAGSAGTFARAGTFMSSFMQPLKLTSPVGGIPYTFPNTYLMQGYEWPLGVERSLVVCTFRALALPAGGDPQFAAGSVLWTYS